MTRGTPSPWAGEAALTDGGGHHLAGPLAPGHPEHIRTRSLPLCCKRGSGTAWTSCPTGSEVWNSICCSPARPPALVGVWGHVPRELRDQEVLSLQSLGLCGKALACPNTLGPPEPIRHSPGCPPAQPSQCPAVGMTPRTAGVPGSKRGLFALIPAHESPTQQVLKCLVSAHCPVGKRGPATWGEAVPAPRTEAATSLTAGPPKTQCPGCGQARPCLGHLVTFAHSALR